MSTQSQNLEHQNNKLLRTTLFNKIYYNKSLHAKNASSKNAKAQDGDEKRRDEGGLLVARRVVVVPAVAVEVGEPIQGKVAAIVASGNGQHRLQ